LPLKITSHRLKLCIEIFHLFCCVRLLKDMMLHGIQKPYNCSLHDDLQQQNKKGNYSKLPWTNVWMGGVCGQTHQCVLHSRVQRIGIFIYKNVSVKTVTSSKRNFKTHYNIINQFFFTFSFIKCFFGFKICKKVQRGPNILYLSN